MGVMQVTLHLLQTNLGHHSCSCCCVEKQGNRLAGLDASICYLLLALHMVQKACVYMAEVQAYQYLLLSQAHTHWCLHWDKSTRLHLHAWWKLLVTNNSLCCCMQLDRCLQNLHARKVVVSLERIDR